jgi:hypothetical protein
MEQSIRTKMFQDDHQDVRGKAYFAMLAYLNGQTLGGSHGR